MLKQEVKIIKVINILSYLFSHIIEKQYLYMIFKKRKRLFKLIMF